MEGKGKGRTINTTTNTNPNTNTNSNKKIHGREGKEPAEVLRLVVVAVRVWRVLGPRLKVQTQIQKTILIAYKNTNTNSNSKCKNLAGAPSRRRAQASAVRETEFARVHTVWGKLAQKSTLPEAQRTQGIDSKT